VQDFLKIREQCLKDGTLFEDPEFPAEDSSVYLNRIPPQTLEWKRPKEIVNNPVLRVKGESSFDMNQGEVKSSWLIAAFLSLAVESALFSRVVPDDQSFGDNYAGIFHFRFWQCKHWVDVVIDDRLPTYSGKLMSLRTAEHNEFWSALLEKAYASCAGHMML
jgi:calpain